MYTEQKLKPGTKVRELREDEIEELHGGRVRKSDAAGNPSAVRQQRFATAPSRSRGERAA